MKFVERQLRSREVFSRPFGEGWRPIAAHPLDIFAVAAVLLEKCLESTQSTRVLALCGEDDLRRIQVHEDRDVTVPSLAGGLVESDIADPRQLPPLESLFRVMPDHAPEACVVHVQFPRQGLDGHSWSQGQNKRLEKQSKPAASRAQGTGTRWTPQEPQWTLGTLAVR